MNLLNCLIQQTSFELNNSEPILVKTRFQGSKRKVARPLFTIFNQLKPKTALDAFSGSGIVSLMLRQTCPYVHANDYQKFSSNTARVFLSHVPSDTSIARHQAALKSLLYTKPENDLQLVAENYKDIFFLNAENQQIDAFCQNVTALPAERQALYRYAVGQALLMKRPYNLFHRANLHMRTANVKRSFGNAKTWSAEIVDHATKCVKELDSMPCMPSCSHNVTALDWFDLLKSAGDYDLVYLDPPYIDQKGRAINYSDFYGFLEGLVDYQLFGSADTSAPHRPMARKKSIWSDPKEVVSALATARNRWPEAAIILSYRIDSIISVTELENAIGGRGFETGIIDLGRYGYALSKSKDSREVIVLSIPNNFAQKVPSH